MELRKVRAENQCKQYQCLAFLGEQEGKVVTVEGYQTREMHLGKFPDHTEFFKLESEFQNGSVFESEKSSSRYPVDLCNRNSQIN